MLNYNLCYIFNIQNSNVSSNLKVLIQKFEFRTFVQFEKKSACENNSNNSVCFKLKFLTFRTQDNKVHCK